MEYVALGGYEGSWEDVVKGGGVGDKCVMATRARMKIDEELDTSETGEYYSGRVNRKT